MLPLTTRKISLSNDTGAALAGEQLRLRLRNASDQFTEDQSYN
jgi:hypothetical protein